MNLKTYAYDMWVLSQEDQRRGNPSGVEMGFDLFRKGLPYRHGAPGGL